MNFDTYMDVEQSYPIEQPPHREADSRLGPKIQLTIHKPKYRVTRQQSINRPTPEQIAAHFIALQLLAGN